MAGVNRELVRRAAVVLEWAPELADEVLAGRSLNNAYTEIGNAHPICAAGKTRQNRRSVA